MGIWGERRGREGREQERSPGIKSARIKNASSETSYSRFLPVVGINRPFRGRCINRDRGRATFPPTLVAPLPFSGVEWLLLFRAHSLRYPRSLTIKLPFWRAGASIVEEVCWVVIYSLTRLACNARYVYTATQGFNSRRRDWRLDCGKTEVSKSCADSTSRGVIDKQTAIYVS